MICDNCHFMHRGHPVSVGLLSAIVYRQTGAGVMNRLSFTGLALVVIRSIFKFFGESCFYGAEGNNEISTHFICCIPNRSIR